MRGYAPRVGPATPKVDARTTPWWPTRRAPLPFTLRLVPESPLDAHVATPQDLKERIAAERRGTPFLVYRDADDLQVIVELAPTGDQLTIGRRPSNDVVLDWDSEISRVHAALERIGEDWTVVDDGLSHNGTYLNGVARDEPAAAQGRRRAGRRRRRAGLPDAGAASRCHGRPSRRWARTSASCSLPPSGAC